MSKSSLRTKYDKNKKKEMITFQGRHEKGMGKGALQMLVSLVRSL